jgi:NosR/NirI family nitrous oxide reductase transcriptional regulator
MKLFRLFLLLCASLCVAVSASASTSTSTVLQEYLPSAKASDLVPGADGFGAVRDDIAAAPVLKGGETVAWVFITSDFVGTTGYSGKPIHTLVAVGTDAKIISVQLVKHSEPIVLIGIPDAKVKALVAGYAGLDLVAEAKSGGTAHDVDIISGATVTVMVIDDSIVRSRSAKYRSPL